MGIFRRGPTEVTLQTLLPRIRSVADSLASSSGKVDDVANTMAFNASGDAELLGVLHEGIEGVVRGIHEVFTSLDSSRTMIDDGAEQAAAAIKSLRTKQGVPISVVENLDNLAAHIEVARNEVITGLSPYVGYSRFDFNRANMPGHVLQLLNGGLDHATTAREVLGTLRSASDSTRAKSELADTIVATVRSGVDILAEADETVIGPSARIQMTSALIDARNAARDIRLAADEGQLRVSASGLADAAASVENATATAAGLRATDDLLIRDGVPGSYPSPLVSDLQAAVGDDALTSIGSEVNRAATHAG